MVPAKRADVAEALKNTPVDELRSDRKAKRKIPTGKGFLHIKQSEYLRLLQWTAKQVDGETSRPVPPSLRELVRRLAIDLTMWRDLVWNFKRYFGKSTCVGSPESMQRFAESVGQNWVSGQRNVKVCFGTD